MNDMISQIVNVVNMDEFINKGLYKDGNFTDKFYILYKNYKILLEKFLINKLPLVEYDNKIDNSGLLFYPVKRDDMDIYQLLSTMDLKYIYLRNVLNVDKLSDDDIELVVNLSDSELIMFDEKMIGLINRTYKDVLSSNRDSNDDTYMVCYGTDRDYFWHDSRDLVFGIRHDEYADNGLGQNGEWLNNYYKQNKLIGDCIKELDSKSMEILGINVHFLKYDEVSVINSMVRR